MMTTKAKPKTPKPPAKASRARRAETATAPKSEPKEVQRVSKIQRLISHWKWLYADQEYQADMAPTEDEAERLIAIHNDEQDKIRDRLAELIPKSISEISCLLEFITDEADKSGGLSVEWQEIDMLRNIGTGLSSACCAEMDDERERDIIRAANERRHGAAARAFMDANREGNEDGKSGP